MSLATRCTHCGTIFKIVQDQLKVSEGWVRCGRCNEIFNALPGLFDLEREPPPPRPKPRVPAQTASMESAAESVVSAAAHSAAVAATTPTAPPQAAPPSSPPASASVSAPSSPPASAPVPEQEWEKTAPIRPGMIAAAREAVAPDAPAPTAPPDTAVATSLAVDAPKSEPIAPTPAMEDDLPDAPPAATEGATDFDLDTSVSGYVDKPSTVTQAVESLNLSHNPQPWLGAPPEEEVPSTDESDALDSRYLMPSTRERKATRRRQRNAPEPEFADAEFPDDAFLDAAEDEWASGFGPSGLHGSSPGQSAYAAPAVASPPPEAAPIDASSMASTDSPEPSEHAATSEAFVPEQALEPPSKRTGKSGTRGRDPAAQTPEFVRRAQRQAFWRHPATRVALSFVTLGLLGSLALQVSLQFRDLIAAHHPGLRSPLVQLCAHAGCTIKPPLRLDDLQVESATLVRASSEGPDNYRLAVVVHNKARIDLAWPHIDLTLTDESGTVIARRAFVPAEAEWLDTADAKAEAAPRSPAAQNAAKAGVTPEAAPADRSTTLLWHLRAPDIKPAGYTAELFYP